MGWKFQVIKIATSTKDIEKGEKGLLFKLIAKGAEKVFNFIIRTIGIYAKAFIYTRNRNVSWILKGT